MKPGELIAGRYRLGTLIGAGGFGEVWRTRDENLGREVALKAIHASIADATARSRFLEEARITASLAHPHVVSVLDFGFLSGDRPFLVYELVEGGGFEAPGLVTSAALRTWGSQLAEALGAAHDQGVLHRDLKPENVLLRGGKEVVLCDFGIARSATKGTRLTAEGLILGTPAYMAPELWVGTAASPASDQFAWAATLIRVAGGGSVYGSDEVSHILEASRGPGPIPLPSLPQLPAEARPVLERALAKDPADRFPTIRAAGRAWFQALASAASGQRVRPVRRSPPPDARAAATVALGTVDRRPTGGTTTRRTRLRRRHYAALGGVVALGLAVGALLVRPGGPPDPTGSSPTSVADPDPVARARTAVARFLEPLGSNLLNLGKETRLQDLSPSTLTWMESPDFLQGLLAAAEATATALTSPAGLPDQEDRMWRTRAAAEEIRDAVSLLRRLAAEQRPLAREASGLDGQLEAVRAALQARLEASGTREEAAGRSRLVVFWATLLMRVGGRPALEPVRQAIRALENEGPTPIRLWMRYRLIEIVQEAMGATCEVQLSLLRDLGRDMPADPPRPGASHLWRALGKTAHRKLLGGVFRVTRECPSAATPELWRRLERTLEIVDRHLVRHPNDAQVLRRQYTQMVAAHDVFDVLGGDPPHVARFRARIELRRLEAKALVEADLPGWVRELPGQLEELAAYLGPDADLPFSGTAARGGPEGFDPEDARRQLEIWLDRCERAFRTPAEDLPDLAWPWISRHLLPAPSRLLRAMAARVAELEEDGDLEPRHEVAWRAVLDRIERLASSEHLTRRYGDSRLLVLAHLLLAQTDGRIGAGDYGIAMSATELEVVDPLRGWMSLVLLDVVRETTGLVCSDRALHIKTIAGYHAWRKDPDHVLEAYRRILVDGTSFASRCWNKLPPGYWGLLETALAHLEEEVPRAPEYVARATDRALLEPRPMLVANLASEELTRFSEEIMRVRAQALEHQYEGQ